MQVGQSGGIGAHDVGALQPQHDRGPASVLGGLEFGGRRGEPAAGRCRIGSEPVELAAHRGPVTGRPVPAGDQAVPDSRGDDRVHAGSSQHSERYLGRMRPHGCPTQGLDRSWQHVGAVGVGVDHQCRLGGCQLCWMIVQPISSRRSLFIAGRQQAGGGHLLEPDDGVEPLGQ